MKYAHGWAFPDADEFMVSELQPDGSYQGAFLAAALRHVTDWSVAIDGGAHAGTWARVLSGCFARVLAFEPSADTFEAFVANMTTFGCDNVDQHRAALGAIPGAVTMAPLDPRAEALKNTGARFVTDGGEIPRVTVDEFGLASLGFLKLDIEGAEVDALLGARETIARCRPIVLYENKGFCRRFGYAKDAPATVLAALGYRQIEAIGTDLIWGPL